MFFAKVVGSVWSSVKWPGLEGLKLLTVRPYALADFASPEGSPLPSSSDAVVVADVLGAGVGEDVIIAYGHAARVAIAQLLRPGEAPTTPIDAAVVAIVDRIDVDATAAAPVQKPKG
jgi:ethanolamine utilization protein EutN